MNKYNKNKENNIFKQKKKKYQNVRSSPKL